MIHIVKGFKQQFSRSVMPESLWLHGLQHTRFLCLSPTPQVYSKSCPLSWWCHPAVSSSVVPFSSSLQSFPASGSLLMSQLFSSGDQVLKLQLQYQSFQWTFRTDFLKDWLVESPCGPRDSQEYSPTSQLHVNPWLFHFNVWQNSLQIKKKKHSAFFIVQLSHTYMTTEKKK